MSIEEENKDLFNRYFMEGNAAKGDITKQFAIMDKYLGSKFVEHVETGDMNLEQYKQLATNLYRAFPDLNFTIEDIVAEGDKVVVRVTMRGTHEDEFLGIAPTGKKVSEVMISIFRIVGGKITEGWAVHDTFGLVQQLGAIPSQ